MKNLKQLFINKKSEILSVFVTAGYPNLHSLETNILELEGAGTDLIEVGIPFSDPMADGKTIQDSSEIALKNGMNLTVLVEQLTEIRKKTTIPLVLMGYLNPVYQYGVEKLLQFCKENSIQGMIIPDISLEEYERNYQLLFKKYNVSLVFIVTPHTSTERLKRIDNLSTTFIYLVSSASVTGSASEFSKEQVDGFEYVKAQNLKSPVLVGFGIHNNSTFKTVSQYFYGAIIGSAFIRHLSKSNYRIKDFVDGIVS
jgi:tryptophan synthase alpha chain